MSNRTIYKYYLWHITTRDRKYWVTKIGSRYSQLTDKMDWNLQEEILPRYQLQTYKLIDTRACVCTHTHSPTSNREAGSDGNFPLLQSEESGFEKVPFKLASGCNCLVKIRRLYTASSLLPWVLTKVENIIIVTINFLQGGWLHVVQESKIISSSLYLSIWGAINSNDFRV